MTGNLESLRELLGLATPHVRRMRVLNVLLITTSNQTNL